MSKDLIKNSIKAGLARTYTEECYEEKMMNRFKEVVLSIADQRYFDKVSPLLTEAIDAKENSTDIYKDLFSDFIKPSIEDFKNKEYLTSYSRYIYYLGLLESKYLNKDNKKILKLK